MKPSLAGFRSFFEAKTRSLDGGSGKDTKNAKNPENHIDAMKRVLGVNPDDLPDIIPTGPITIRGVQYNQATIELKKPIEPNAKVVQVRFIPSEELNSPSLNQVAVKDGQNYMGKPITGWVPVTMQWLAELLQRPLQPPAGGGAGGPPGMGGPPMPGMM